MAAKGECISINKPKRFEALPSAKAAQVRKKSDVAR